MSLRIQDLRSRLAITISAVMAILAMAGIAVAQDQPVPKVDIFAGYSWADSNGARVGGTRLRSWPAGGGAAVTYNFNKYFGGTVDFATHYTTKNTDSFNLDSHYLTVMIGPKFTYRSEHFAPFIEALVGLSRLTPDTFRSNSKIGFQGGGGIDLTVNRHFGVRVAQVDYIAADHRFAPASIAPATKFGGVRLQSGVIFSFGGGEQGPPPAASCSLQPSQVMAGDPVKVTATASNFPKKATLSYNWTTTGGKVSGNDANTTVDTTGLAPGNYTVTANATDNKKATAQCTASFTVQTPPPPPPKNPPTMSCSTNPATVRAGEPSTVTCDCKSPDGRTVNVNNWTASSGKLSGTGATATLDTAGAAPGPITISASCSDDRGLNTQANASVNVEAPPPPPTASKSCEFDFTNKAKLARVDNAAKACLDGAADSLTQNPNAKAVLVGQQDTTERPRPPRLAEERAVNAKAYLTSGENQKAIDASRIEPRAGSAGGAKIEVWIVPEGATFDQTGTTPVNEARIKPQMRKPAPPKHRPARKKAAKPA